MKHYNLARFIAMQLAMHEIILWFYGAWKAWTFCWRVGGLSIKKDTQVYVGLCLPNLVTLKWRVLQEDVFGILLLVWRSGTKIDTTKSRQIYFEMQMTPSRIPVTTTWRIIPLSKWLIAMVIRFRPLRSRVVGPLPNGLFLAYKWGWS